MDLREQKFGIEIEMTGITRKKAAQVIGDYFGTEPYYHGGAYRSYSIEDGSGRDWKVVYDSSITAQKKSAGRMIIADTDYRVELVSPICTYRDIETIQQLIRNLRGARAFVNASCGIHVHINAAPFEAKQLRNLVNIVAAKEDLIYRALQVERSREQDYCQKIDPLFLKKINEKKPKTREGVKELWYRGSDGSSSHYHYSRYRCLNLHSVFQKNTIEFRAFNASMHAGVTKAYLQFCLAITAQAYNQRGASPNKTVSTNEKYTFRVWLLRLGMIGDEFKSARKHLLGHLEGNIAWKSPEQAEAQKERLRARKEKEQEEKEQSTRFESEGNEESSEEFNMEHEQGQGEIIPAFSMQMGM